MPLAPLLQTIVDAAAALPPLETLSVAAARARFEAAASMQAEAAMVESVEQQEISLSTGSMRLRIYRPIREIAGPLPILLYFHGSGFVVCSLDTHDKLCRNLCAGSEFLVLSLEYRLSPEHKFPAAPDDCLAAAVWVAANARHLGGDPSKLFVGGDSAGGNLAAVTAIRARDAGGPRLSGQLLIYPVTGSYVAPHPSWSENGQGCGLTVPGITWFQKHYFRTEADANDPGAVPLLTESLVDLPPALIQVAEFDLLRDEGIAYGKRLESAGCRTITTLYPSMNHGFVQQAGRLAGADAALREACQWLIDTCA